MGLDLRLREHLSCFMLTRLCMAHIRNMMSMRRPDLCSASSAVACRAA